MKPEERIWILLARKLAGEATDKDLGELQKLLKENPDIFQFAQLKHIASYLGVTKTSLSRIRNSSRSISHS